MKPRLDQLQDALDRMGNTHTVFDILTAITTGEMQSFAVNNTWVVTQVCTLPQRKVLDIFMVVGERADLPEAYDQVFAFARNRDCTLVRAFGRTGWQRDAEKRGWRTGMQIYTKVLEKEDA